MPFQHRTCFTQAPESPGQVSSCLAQVWVRTQDLLHKAGSGLCNRQDQLHFSYSGVGQEAQDLLQSTDFVLSWLNMAPVYKGTSSSVLTLLTCISDTRHAWYPDSLWRATWRHWLCSSQVQALWHIHLWPHQNDIKLCKAYESKYSAWELLI